MLGVGEVPRAVSVLVLSFRIALMVSFVWAATKRSSLGVWRLSLALCCGPPLLRVVVVA